MVKIDLSLGALQQPTHVNDHSVTEAMLRAVVVTASVYLEVDHVSSLAFCQCPHLYPPLDGLHGHVLPKPKSTFEFDH